MAGSVPGIIVFPTTVRLGPYVMPLPVAEEREPWPKPRRPMPLWPLVVGPLLGLSLTFIPSIESRLPRSSKVEFGFGSGVLLGLVMVLGILLGRRQFILQTWLVGLAAVVVLVGLVRALLI